MNRIDPKRHGRVLLVTGGDSAEREISLKSGAAVAAAFERLGVAFETCDGVQACLQRIAVGGIDKVFNILHGRGGEDGVLQGALAALGAACTGSGVLGSALAMDKLASKRLWAGCGLPTPPFRVASTGAEAATIADQLHGPWFVKPAREGSSVGMSRVECVAELEAALERALDHDDTALVEQLIDGPEYTVAILTGRALPMIRIETPRAFYDYQAKYQSSDTLYHCPAGLEPARERELQALALAAFAALGGRGWGRVDLMVDASGQPWLLEANTVPGMTDHSLVPMAAHAAGLDFDALVDAILDTAEARP
ncbi:MAG: D-alanine--D-alanine ligase [Wenzhouxiangellaceae bacterium]|nr:D-alanine--D-alanine ligase [Wenzhouxiangellaceae bacterium]